MAQREQLVADEDLRNAGNALSYVLEHRTYAIVGGAACRFLGSTRTTYDVDVVVPRGATAATRRLLEASNLFNVDARTRHTVFGDVEVELLAPPAMFQEAFDISTPTLVIDGIRILHPIQLLNAKCGSMPGRASEHKKLTDATDILFLLGYCASNGYRIGAADVPNATEEFVNWTVTYMDIPQNAWDAAGYNGACGPDGLYKC